MEFYKNAANRNAHFISQVDLTKGELVSILQFLDGDLDLDSDSKLFTKLLNHYADTIPYGALTGDDMTTDDWLFNRLLYEFEDIINWKHQPEKSNV